MKPMKNLVEGLSGESILVSKLLTKGFCKGTSVLFDRYGLGRGRHKRAWMMMMMGFCTMTRVSSMMRTMINEMIWTEKSMKRSILLLATI